MKIDYLHNHRQFKDLILIISDKLSIAPILVEKDYWIMHCLYGLEKQGMHFQMKGGTSLSKGFKLINRFSEDIDILIEPPQNMEIYTGRNQDKPFHRQSRLDYYNWLAEYINIDGIKSVKRDTAFDDEKYRSGGIRLFYNAGYEQPNDIKEGILLEVGFDEVTPNTPKTISSWAYDYAKEKVELKNNTAKKVLCYNPGYTLVEKLQTISTKFRNQQTNKIFSDNFMRHYYDVYCLLKDLEIQKFIGTTEYNQHKTKRFRDGDNPHIAKNEAFIMSDPSIKNQYMNEYNKSKSLYYKEKPEFDQILSFIQSFADKL